ncbi:MAG TPA: PspC domain-containing protein, partial [Roseiflexaceae bacterium]|nr:PspC domain-containing protein [Roseiflexaceae bacterium]
MQPQLTRSRSEVVIAGVCGGLAEYFHIDPVIVRLVFVLVTLTSGLGLIVYPVLWMVMPKA